jgi:hypothetical protein
MLVALLVCLLCMSSTLQTAFIRRHLTTHGHSVFCVLLTEVYRASPSPFTSLSDSVGVDTEAKHSVD